MDYKRLQVYFFMAMFTASLVLTLFVFRPYLGLIAFSGVLAVLAAPTHSLLTKAFRGQSALAAFATVILTLVVLLLPLAFMIISLSSEAISVFNTVREQVDFQDVETTLSRIIGAGQAHAVAGEAARAIANIADYVRPYFAGFTANVLTLFSNIAAILFDAFIVLFGMYYLLKDGRALKRVLLDLSPLSDADDNGIFERVRDAIRAVAFGSFAVAVIKGLSGGLFWWILGLKAPVFWGSMIALTSFVPGIGTAIVTVPFVVYLFATGHFWSGLVLSLVSILIIGLVDNFAGPHLIKSRIDIHPLLILLAILGGLSVFGVLGVFFGPIILAVALALLDIYKKEFRQELEKLR